MPVIGFLHSASPGTRRDQVVAFQRGLNEVGFFEGRNVGIEYRWAEHRYDRLPELAADLVRSRVAVIVATGNMATALAAKAVTTTIPIVFMNSGDPIPRTPITGIAACCARPASGHIAAAPPTSVMKSRRFSSGRDVHFMARPPPRSVRAAFPHTAPASGV